MHVKTQESFHFIGIGGIGMSGLARMLLQQGKHVSGSDCAARAIMDELAQQGAIIYKSHAAHQVPEDAVVIYSSDIPESNCEWQKARLNQANMLHRATLLSQLMQSKHALAVAGTHGKTTTSALLAWVLQHAGLSPSFAIGGFLKGTFCNSASGQGDLFVAEADESDGSFLQYAPFGAIVTNVDCDHLPFFGTIQNIQLAFSQFMQKVQRPELLFWCIDDVGLRYMNAAQQIPKGVSYGWHAEAGLQGMDYRQEGLNTVFSCTWQGKTYRDLKVPLPGRHAALNALAVFGMAHQMGVSEEQIRAAFTSFPGVERRFSLRGEVNSVLVFDDYGHHPTEIQSALSALAAAYPERRLIVLYQPHRYSRAKDCLGAYQGKGIFDAAHVVLITEIYAAGEKVIEGVSHHQIVEEVREGFKGICEAVQRDALENKLFEILRPHDLVVCLGAGDITAFSQKLPTLLQTRKVTKYRLALLCGGPSSEHAVSLLSMQQLLPQWQPDLYDLECFGITQEGEWIAEEQLLEQLGTGSATPRRYLHTAPGASSRIPLATLEKLLSCDLVVPILHGEWGEDGIIQGFCEVLGIPYVGCDVRASAVGMDKSIIKAICAYHGIPSVPSVVVSKRAWQEEITGMREKISALGDFPLWVKPAHLGSSVCVERVFTAQKLEQALAQVFKCDTLALVEKEIVGRELECAVLGNDNVQVLVPGEVLTETLPYDYDGKYCSQGTPTQDIAKLSPEHVQKAMELSKQVYQLLGCQGLTRVDLFLDLEGNCLLNEVNTFPGFTKNSLYPRMCVANGLSINALLDRLVILALSAARTKKRPVKS